MPHRSAQDVVTFRWVPPLERPLEALRTLTELRRTLDQLERLIVAEARRGKCTWDEIGESLGISRQAAHRRHARLVNETSGARHGARHRNAG